MRADGGSVIPPAPGARTIRMCSLDGRNRGITEPPVPGNESLRGVGGEGGQIVQSRLVLAQRAASEGPRWTRAVGDQQATCPRECKLPSFGEEEKGVDGRVKACDSRSPPLRKRSLDVPSALRPDHPPRKVASKG